MLCCFLLSACSLDASIVDTGGVPSISIEKLNRTDPDFVSGEVITTSAGFRVRAVFGEVSERQVLASGHEIEGVISE